jgi:hypothetical protein
VEAPAHTQGQKSVRMKQHQKKMAEAYNNFEIIFKVVKLMSIDFESCRHKMACNVIGLSVKDMGFSDMVGRCHTKCRTSVFLITGTTLFIISTFH